MRALDLSHAARLLLVLVVLVTSSSALVHRASAQEGLRDPREIATTEEEAGKYTTLVQDLDGTDEYGRWVDRRWIRDRESSEFHVGPVILDNIVWVTKDVETAKKLFKVQSDKNTEMPEREVNRDAAKGPFPFVVKEGQMPKELAEDASAMSACVDCDVKTVILTHHRIVLRKGNVVTVVYIFGRDNVATPEVAIWHARQVADRM